MSNEGWLKLKGFTVPEQQKEQLQIVIWEVDALVDLHENICCHTNISWAERSEISWLPNTKFTTKAEPKSADSAANAPSGNTRLKVRRVREAVAGMPHLLEGVFHNWKRKRVLTRAAFQTTAPDLQPRCVSFHCHTGGATHCSHFICEDFSHFSRGV